MAGAALGAEVEGVTVCSGGGPRRGGGDCGFEVAERWSGRFLTCILFSLQAEAVVTVAFTKEALKKAMGPLAETPGRSSVARVGMTGAGSIVAEQTEALWLGPWRAARVFVIRGQQKTHQISPGHTFSFLTHCLWPTSFPSDSVYPV